MLSGGGVAAGKCPTRPRVSRRYTIRTRPACRKIVADKLFGTVKHSLSEGTSESC